MANGGEIPPCWQRAIAMGLKTRTLEAQDLPLLKRIYASTRDAELAMLPWSEAEKVAFLDMQFNAQHTHYSAHYGHMDWLLLKRDGGPIGRLYLERLDEDHSIIDIALLPEHRGRGLGTALMEDILDEAAALGKTVTIHVEKFNPALRLYRRLGFTMVKDEGVYDQMRWMAPSETTNDQVNTAS